MLFDAPSTEAPRMLNALAESRASVRMSDIAAIVLAASRTKIRLKTAVSSTALLSVSIDSAAFADSRAI
jgi:hypothetical protein